MINDKLLKQIRQSNDYYWRFGSHCIFGKKDQIKKGNKYIDPTSPKYRIVGINNTYKDVYVEQMSDKEIKGEFIKLIQPKALDKHKFEAVINFCKLNGVEEWIIRYSGSGDDGCIDECILDEKHKKLKMNKNLCDACDTEVMKPLEEVIKEFCYDALETHHGGWEINDGAHGEFIYKDKKIKHTHNRAVEEYETTNETYEVKNESKSST